VPETGKTFAKGDTAAVVDSVKAASDVYAPVSGDVTEANAALDGEPELVNTSPETEGWLWRQTVADAADLAELMDEAAYKAFIAEL
jgi:glycine cleavage system H protein